MKTAKKKKHGVEETKCDLIQEKKEKNVFEFDILVEMLVIDDKKS